MSRKAFFIPDFLPEVTQAAHAAGRLIMGFYQGGHAVDRKQDASPVTEADRAADRLIVAVLAALAPFPIVSEEGLQPEVNDAEYFWLVDPLDGTKSFVRGSGYFTVNIGLINAERVPVLGVIYDPVHDVMYAGSESGAFRGHATLVDEPIHVRDIPPSGPVALISHAHIDKKTVGYLDARGIINRIPCASSIKLCWLAEGRADLYPRFGPTMEWDTAAGHAILLAAGGRVETPEGKPFLYNKPGFANGHFVAFGS